LLNCDNLRHNGERFRHGFLSFLQAKGESELYQWVEKNTTSPNTMVDRITPRPTPDVAERVLAATGIKDAVPVMGESFIQWVIEDDFINGRPALEQVGWNWWNPYCPGKRRKSAFLTLPIAASRGRGR
jgi:D-arabinitol 4-dehydrogenase